MLEENLKQAFIIVVKQIPLKDIPSKMRGPLKDQKMLEDEKKIRYVPMLPQFVQGEKQIYLITENGE